MIPLILNVILFCLCVLLLIVSSISIYQITIVKMPKNIPLTQLKNVLVTRILFTILLSIIYMVIISKDIDGFLFGWWDISFGYTLIVILLCDVWMTNTYITCARKKLNLKRRGDKDKSGVSKRETL